MPSYIILNSKASHDYQGSRKQNALKKALHLFHYKSVSSARMYSPRSAWKKWEKIKSANFICQSAVQILHLVECNNVHGVRVPALRGGFCSHPKPNGQVSHAVHDHTLVPEEGRDLKGSNLQKCLLWSVLRDPAQPTFHNVMPIQELLLCRSFHPDLREKF